MFTPPKETVNGVKFYRGNLVCAVIRLVTGECTVQTSNDRYMYGCLSNSIYKLTIPAENMTEHEQRSTWSCKYVFNSSYRSPDAILKIASMIKKSVLNQTFTFIKKCLIILFS